jgi:sortase A
VAHVYRILGVVGRVMVTAGVILLLFVGYQLWGTGIHTRAAQAALEDELVQSLRVATEGEGDGEVAGEGEGGGASDGASDGETPAGEAAPPGEEAALAAPPERPTNFGDGQGIGEAYGLSPKEVANLPPPAPSAPVGFISIPAIDSNYWYVEGTNLDWLRDGPGHFVGTSFPGQKGNAALAGHRTTYGAPFHRVDELVPGDEILVETVQGEFRYEVVSRGELAEDMPIAVDDPAAADEGHFIIGPSDTWILKDYDDNRITLMACHPKYSAEQRIVVVGELDGPVAPTTPPSKESTEIVESRRDDGGDELLATDLAGGDEAARVPAALWALAAGAVWIVAWQVGRTWPRAKWPAYVLGTPVFLVVLYGCFAQVERLLPAGY